MFFNNLKNISKQATSHGVIVIKFHIAITLSNYSYAATSLHHKYAVFLCVELRT